jgi:hypothetical protein
VCELELAARGKEKMLFLQFSLLENIYCHWSALNMAMMFPTSCSYNPLP